MCSVGGTMRDALCEWVFIANRECDKSISAPVKMMRHVSGRMRGIYAGHSGSAAPRRHF